MATLDYGHKRRPWRVATCAAALSLVSLSLAACGGGSSSDGAGLEVSPTTPEPNGEIDSFVWNLPVGEPISLDPLKSYNYSENTVLGNACEALLSIGPDFSLEPRLAESYERVSPTVWEYTLRDGVKFWDGSPMTAQDVVYSLERHLDPANGSFYLEPFAAEISEVEEIDQRTVRVVTSRPSVIVNEMMATGLGTIGKADYIEQQGKAYGTPQGGLMCTGPFKFGEWSPGRSLTLDRNDDYWDQDNMAFAKQVEFEFIDDLTLLTNALLSGEIDGTYEAPASGIPQLRDSGNGDVFLGPAVNNVALLPTLTGIQGPLADVRTREAIFQAIDLEGISETVYAGAAEPLRSTLILPIDYPFAAQQFEDAYNSLPEPAGDPEQAKKLIDEAGVEIDKPVTLAIQAGDPRSTQTATAIVDAASRSVCRWRSNRCRPGTSRTSFSTRPRGTSTTSCWPTTLVTSQTPWSFSPSRRCLGRSRTSPSTTIQR